MARLARSGVDRAAILLLALGEQDAAQVLKHLGAKDVQRVGAAMAQLSAVSREEVSGVLATFSNSVEQQTSFGVGTDEYIRKVLIEALGADKAGGVIDRILRGRSSRGLEALKWMEPRAVAEMLRYEHPQIICDRAVLSGLGSGGRGADATAGEHARRYPDAHRDTRWRASDRARMSSMRCWRSSSPATVGAKTAGGFGGPKAAAEILNLVGTAQEGHDHGADRQDRRTAEPEAAGSDVRVRGPGRGRRSRHAGAAARSARRQADHRAQGGGREAQAEVLQEHVGARRPR